MFYELADRLVPGLVVDVYCPFAFRHLGGVIFQVKKRRPRDEGYQRNILVNALGVQPGIRLVIAVDDDVDLYSMDDVMWAIMSRTEPATDYLRGAVGSRGVSRSDFRSHGEIWRLRIQQISQRGLRAYCLPDRLPEGPLSRGVHSDAIKL